jgi:invasion protein IalB
VARMKNEKILRRKIALEKMIAYIFKKPRIVIRELPEKAETNKSLKWVFYIVVPSRWKIKAISVMPIPEGKVENFSYERCLYDKCLYYSILTTRFEEKGKKIIMLIIDFGKRVGLKTCRIKIKIRNGKNKKL